MLLFFFNSATIYVSSAVHFVNEVHTHIYYVSTTVWLVTLWLATFSFKLKLEKIDLCM